MSSTTSNQAAVQNHVAITEALQQKNNIQKDGIKIDYKHSAFVEFCKYMTGPAVVQAVNKTIFAPLERMKIIHQAQNALYINEKAKFKNFFQFLQRIPTEQGIKAYWRGNFANIMYIIPRTIAQFAFFENINHFFFPAGEKNITELEYALRKFSAALTAGFCTLSLAYPFDLAKTRLSLEFAKNKYDKQFTGVLSALGETRRRGGFTGLYKGFWLANFTNIPYYLTLFTNLQIFKSMNQSEVSNSELFQYLAPASIAGLVSTLVVYPLDTVKRRLQINGYNGNFMYKGTWDCFKKIWDKEGALSLYRGITITSVKFLGSAALQTILVAYYSQLKKQYSLF
ncbi:solute carrier family protein (macronuclear) [Tetrahymena thermophila SB210]|uniref:Solute carrier family protein n=1 Tax=Tetrahymena thermophila (strain SB210) TaxID=312017 RepID=Q24D15_TETTS|nr:solute carrier family protein [Tetrahymena thermophila SB210]EAS05593.1 solute carrier family protein [Tetrahymena thermophila SB210]|eukprot:XP_001025838.1 solute carrier family protein [Tetrahymena thermophila SB210]